MCCKSFLKVATQVFDFRTNTVIMIKRSLCIFLFPQRVRLAEVKKQEQDLLENQSIPLRNYLMKHVMPTLTQGLVECCKIRPEDPIDYVVRYGSLLV